jgi:hypothetical protein
MGAQDENAKGYAGNQILVTRMGTRDTTSPVLGRKEQGGLPRVGLKARARGPYPRQFRR